MNKHDSHTQSNTTKNFNVINDFASMGLENFQKMTNLQLKIASETLQQASDNVKTLTSIKNPQQLLEHASEITKNRIKTNNENFQDFVSLANDTKSKFLQTSMEYFKTFKTANLNNISNLFTKSQNNNSGMNKIVDSFENLSNNLFDDSKEVADNTAKNTSKAIDSVNTAVKNNTHNTTKAASDKKAVSHTKNTTHQHKKPTSHATTTHEKKKENSKDSVADKVVDEAKKVV